MEKDINYGTRFKFEWAEGKQSVTDKYVGKELTLQEFIYIITKRHHEIATENIENGFYGCYDKHKVLIKHFGSDEWEPLDRFDLGNDTDFYYIKKDLEDSFTKDLDFYWSDLVAKGKELWEAR